MGSEQNNGTSVPRSKPILCANGCGFLGTTANMNLCSKCYRGLCVKEEQAASTKAMMKKTLSIKSKQEDVILVAPSPILVPTSSKIVLTSESSSSISELLIAGGDKAQPKAANRCFSCNKKIGLTGFKCKCGSTFYGNHRYPENHDCLFDFKGVGRNAITKANPIVKAAKVERI